MYHQPITPATDATPTDAARELRHDGWTPERQRVFLEGIADGLTVAQACRAAGMGTSGAYAFRRRAAGKAFALGWRAANILYRDRFADQLMDRALEGQVTTITRPDGSVVERHAQDNRLALSLLARLDRMADGAPAGGASGDGAAAADSRAARVVAQDFDAFLDLVGTDAGPARAGQFVAARCEPSDDDALDPVHALARADLWCRTGAGTPAELDTSDLDPAGRAGWTAKQWARAEAAGLLVLAPEAEEEEEDDPLDPHCPLRSPHGGPEPVWWDDEAEEYRTWFPPTPDADVIEQGERGSPVYQRSLTLDELAAMEALVRADTDERCAAGAETRDAFFAECRELVERHDAATGGTPATPAPLDPAMPGDEEDFTWITRS